MLSSSTSYSNSNLTSRIMINIFLSEAGEAREAGEYEERDSCIYFMCIREGKIDKDLFFKGLDLILFSDGIIFEHSNIEKFEDELASLLEEYADIRKTLNVYVSIEYSLANYGISDYYGLVDGWKDDTLREEAKKIDLSLKSKTFLPEIHKVFRAFSMPPEKIRVLILGQDCYPKKGDAMGLAFGVERNRNYPKSLVNIFSELRNCGYENIETGDLTYWAKQGVFLLNTALTVEEGKPNSHGEIWKGFTRRVMEIINERCEFLVAILWGANARNAGMILNTKFAKIETSHPSPLSAHLGFIGSNCFSRCNDILKKRGYKEIDWNVRRK